MPADLTADTPAASKDGKAMPTKPGYYWAKWRIAADGTHEGDELTPSDFWGIVEVNENAPGQPEHPEYLSVAVPGVRETQWPDCFVWGDFVAPLAGIEKAHPPSAAAHVATLTAKLEARDSEISRNEVEYAKTAYDLTERLARETARADAAEKEVKALREALFTIKRGHTDGDLGGATWRPLHQNEIKAIVDRATLAQPAADGGAT